MKQYNLKKVRSVKSLRKHGSNTDLPLSEKWCFQGGKIVHMSNISWDLLIHNNAGAKKKFNILSFFPENVCNSSRAKMPITFQAYAHERPCKAPEIQAAKYCFVHTEQKTDLALVQM